MSKCNWDPAKHGGRPCPIHGSGMWDENILTKKDKIEKLKGKGYSEEEIEEELKTQKFDDDDDFNIDEYDEDYERSYGVPVTDESIWEEISGDEYAYGGLNTKEDLAKLLNKRAQVPLKVANKFVENHWNEYQKEFGNDDSKEYDFDNEQNNEEQGQDKLLSKLPNDIQSWLNRNDQLNVEIEAPSGDDTIYFKTTDKETGDETQYSYNPRTGITDHTNNQHFGSVNEIQSKNASDNKSMSFEDAKALIKDKFGVELTQDLYNQILKLK